MISEVLRGRRLREVNPKSVEGLVIELRKGSEDRTDCQGSLNICPDACRVRARLVPH